MQDSFDFSDPDSESPVQDATASEDSLPSWSLSEVLAAVDDDVVVATVNRRLSRHLTERHSRHRVAAGDLWWDSPSILPLSNWLAVLHDTALAAGTSTQARLVPLASRLRWRRVVASSHPNLLDVDATARQAMRAWQLAHTWACLPDADAWLGEDAHAWRGWSNTYASALADDGLVDEAGLSSHIASLVAEGKLQPPRVLVLAGYLQLTPELTGLAAAMTMAGAQVVTLAEATPAEPKCVSWQDDREEMAAVAQAVRETLDRSPEAVLGVVVPDLDARRMEVRRTFDRAFFPGASPEQIDAIGRPYDLSAGGALGDVPVASSAMDAIALAWLGLDRHRVSRLLLSPYLRDADDEAQLRERLERRLRDWRVRHCSLQRVRNALDEQSSLRGALAGLGKLIEQARGQDGSAGATRALWADRFSDVLRAVGWPGTGLSSDEYQAVQAMHSVFDDLQSLDDGERVSVDQAYLDVTRLAQERVFQPETAELPVRVLGRLESHGQYFDALWVIGLDSERWPAQGKPTPFLSVQDQRNAGMPEASPAARLALAHIEYRHWCASAASVTVSHARERDDKPLVPATVLENITLGSHTADQTSARVQAVVATETVDDPCGPAIVPGETVRGGARLLEDQAVCPFRAFTRHRLGTRDLEEPELGLDPRQRGTLLHRALEFFWQEVRSQSALLALDSDALRAQVEASVDAAFAEDTHVDSRIADLERVRISALVLEWLEAVEKKRAPFTVEAFEQKVEFEHGGVGIRLALDRIDCVGDSRVVIDYKTGRRDSVSTWADARIGSPQLPLYALTRDDVQGVAFGRVARGACGFAGIADSEEWLAGVGPGDPPREWEEWREHWRGALDTVAREVADGFAVALPSAEACKYCELGGVCRADLSEPTESDEVLA